MIRFHKRLGRASSILSIVVGLETLFPAVALALIDEHGWRDAFAWMAFIVFAALLLVLFLLRNSPEAEKIPGAGDGLLFHHSRHFSE